MKRLALLPTFLLVLPLLHCCEPDMSPEYKIENDTLVLYVWNKAIEPESDTFPIKVVQKEFSPLAYREMEKNAATLGLKYLQIEIDKA